MSYANGGCNTKDKRALRADFHKNRRDPDFDEACSAGGPGPKTFKKRHIHPCGVSKYTVHQSASKEEANRLTQELAAVNARAEAMAKFLEGFSPDDLARSGDLRAARGEIELLDAENAEMRRTLGTVAPGFHGHRKVLAPVMERPSNMRE